MRQSAILFYGISYGISDASPARMLPFEAAVESGRPDNARERGGTADASAGGMLTPFGDAFAEAEPDGSTHVPEVIAIEDLTGAQLEAAEAEIEAEEAWPQTA